MCIRDRNKTKLSPDKSLSDKTLICSTVDLIASLSIKIVLCSLANKPKNGQFETSDFDTKHAGSIEPKITISKYEQ